MSEFLSQNLDTSWWEKHYNPIGVENITSQQGGAIIQLLEGNILVGTIDREIPKHLLKTSVETCLKLSKKNLQSRSPLISVLDLTYLNISTLQLRYTYGQMMQKIIGIIPIQVGIVIGATLTNKIVMKLFSQFISYPLFFVKTKKDALPIIEQYIVKNTPASSFDSMEQKSDKKDEKEIIYAAIMHHLSTLVWNDTSPDVKEERETPLAAKEVIDSLTLFKKDIQSLLVEKKECEQDLNNSIARTREIAAQRAQFLRHLNHIISSPMKGIMESLTLLKETEITAEQNEYLSIVATSSDNLLELVTKVLAIAEAESGTIKIDKNNCDIRQIVTETANLFSAKAKKKNLALQTVFAENIPDIIISDAGKIKQIITNLLNNAILYTETGSISFSVFMRNNNLHISITDTGPGISEDAQLTIFDQFVRGKTAIGQQGSGLGLSIVNHLASLLDGHIALESELGKGSTFTLTLPLEIDTVKSDTPPLLK